MIWTSSSPWGTTWKLGYRNLNGCCPKSRKEGLSVSFSNPPIQNNKHNDEENKGYEPRTEANTEMGHCTRLDEKGEMLRRALAFAGEGAL